VGIKVDNKLHLVDFFFRRIAPISLVKRVEGIVGLLPKWAQRAFFFFPPLYLLTLTLALFTKVFGAAEDVSLMRTDLSSLDTDHGPSFCHPRMAVEQQAQQ
jgi:hypothetical protein